MVRRSASGEPCCCCCKIDLTNDCTLLPLPVSDGNSRWTDPYIHAARAASPQGMFGSLLSAMLQENCCRMAQCIQGMMFFFVFFLWGYRGIVYSPSNDEGTERTWFEPK